MSKAHFKSFSYNSYLNSLTVFNLVENLIHVSKSSHDFVQVNCFEFEKNA